MNYLHLFENRTAHDTVYNGGGYQEPWLAYIKGGNAISFDREFAKEYLTFQTIEDGTFKLTDNTVNYSLDGGKTWNQLAANTETPIVNAGKTIMFKAELEPSVDKGIGTFSSSGMFNVVGNPHSLLFGDNFVGQNDLTGKRYAFFSLFQESKVVDAAKMILPASTLSTYCYVSMFDSCPLLKNAPELHATTLAENCCNFMFAGCTSLTTAPALPATTLANYCYEYMFNGCTSLTAAPELPATTLADGCYSNMFKGCTALTVANEIPAEIMPPNCCEEMFCGCTSLVTAPELPATTLANYCYMSMFSGCTSLIKAPVLPAKRLSDACYYAMFSDCSNLNYIKALFLTFNPNATSYWVKGVSETGTFVKASTANWNVIGNDGVPNGWTIEAESE